MLKKSSALMIALLMSTGLVIAAENNGSAGNSMNASGIGPDPKHVTGGAQAGAGPTGSGGTGLEASRAGTNQGSTGGQTAKGQTDGSGATYIDCPGNAFSPSGDCVPPSSVRIEGSDNMRRDNSSSGHAVGEPSRVGSSSGSSNNASNNAGNNADQKDKSPAEKVEQGGSSFR
jgi:hypothetical protein